MKMAEERIKAEGVVNRKTPTPVPFTEVRILKEIEDRSWDVRILQGLRLCPWPFGAPTIRPQQAGLPRQAVLLRAKGHARHSTSGKSDGHTRQRDATRQQLETERTGMLENSEAYREMVEHGGVGVTEFVDQGHFAWRAGREDSSRTTFDSKFASSRRNACNGERGRAIQHSFTKGGAVTGCKKSSELPGDFDDQNTEGTR